MTHCRCGGYPAKSRQGVRPWQVAGLWVDICKGVFFAHTGPFPGSAVSFRRPGSATSDSVIATSTTARRWGEEKTASESRYCLQRWAAVAPDCAAWSRRASPMTRSPPAAPRARCRGRTRAVAEALQDRSETEETPSPGSRARRSGAGDFCDAGWRPAAPANGSLALLLGQLWYQPADEVGGAAGLKPERARPGERGNESLAG